VGETSLIHADALRMDPELARVALDHDGGVVAIIIIGESTDGAVATLDPRGRAARAPEAIIAPSRRVARTASLTAATVDTDPKVAALAALADETVVEALVAARTSRVVCRELFRLVLPLRVCRRLAATPQGRRHERHTSRAVPLEQRGLVDLGAGRRRAVAVVGLGAEVAPQEHRLLDALGKRV
jgi:hypothetical protein